MAQLLHSATFVSRKADGTPNALGKLYTYAAGTLTAQATYTTQAGTVENTNPVTLSADGTAQVWLDPALSYRVIEKTAALVTIRDVDNITSTDLTAADLASSSSASLGAGQVGYSGSVAYVGKTVGAELKTRVSVFAFMTAAEIADVKARTKTIDVGPKINAALAAAEHVYLPAGDYLCTTMVAATNRATLGRNTMLEGAGAGWDDAAYGATIWGNTALWMADFTGSQWVKLKNVNFRTYTAGATPSIHGLRFARAVNPNDYCHNIYLENVMVICASSTAAAGGQGSIAVLNNQCEQMRTSDCWLTADTPYLSMMNNECSISGVADAGVYSNTLQTHCNTVFQSTWKTAMSLYGAADMDFQRCIWTTDNVTASAVWAITLNNSAAAYQYCSKMKFTGQVERFTKVCYFGSLGSPAGGANYTDIELDLTKVSSGGAPSTLCTVWTGTAGANLFNVRVDIDQQNATPGTQDVWEADAGNTGTINLYGGSTTLYQNTSGTPYAINNALIKPLGHFIDAGAAGASFTASGIVVAAASSYRVSTFNSYLRGSATWNPASVADTDIVNTAVTVTGAALGDSVRVFPPYSLQGLLCSAYVDSSNTVQIILGNMTGGAIDLASGVWSVVVEKS